MTRFFCDICGDEGNPIAEATIEINTIAPSKKLKVKIAIGYTNQFRVDLCNSCLTSALYSIAADCRGRVIMPSPPPIPVSPPSPPSPPSSQPDDDCPF